MAGLDFGLAKSLREMSRQCSRGREVRGTGTRDDINGEEDRGGLEATGRGPSDLKS